MKKIIVCIIVLTNVQLAFSQVSEISMANDCYDKKEYQCAIDNYKIAIEKKTYKEGQLYLLEYRIGVGYSSLNQYGLATEYLNKALVSMPGYYSCYWELGNIYYNTDKFQDAVIYYKKAYDGAPNATDKETLTWWIARSYYEQKNYTSAISEFKKIQSRTGTFIEADAFIGDAFYFSKKYDSAIAYYKKGVAYYKAEDATAKNINCFIGKCYRELGKTKEANEQQDAILAIDPTNASAMWEKGILSANKKDYTAAIDWYKKTMPAYAKDSSDSYTLMSNIAACYLSQSNYAEAVNWQIKKKPFSKNPYKEYLKTASIQYGRLKQNKEAEKTCTEAINQYLLEPAEKLKSITNDEYVKLNSIMGKIALEKKDTVNATKYFETALKLNKNNYEANAGAAQIAWARKNENEYKKYFNNIYKSAYDTLLSSKKDIATVYGRAAHTDAYINKTTYYTSGVESALLFDSLQKEAVLLWPVILTSGSASNLSSKRNASLSIINQAIKQYAADKSYVSDLYNTKAVMLESKDTGAIHTALDMAVKVYPDNVKAWDNLMKYYGSYDNTTGAIMVEKLITIIKKQKDNASTATAYIYKGDFLWRLNKKEEAKKAWQEALVWDANNATAKERVKM